MKYFQRVFGGFRSLVTGLSITIRQLFKKPVTMEYPHKEPTLSPAYRSAIKLIRFEETGTHDCVACLACQHICPSFCIDIKGGKIEGIKKKRATEFTMDFALCSLCGLCIDVCPTTTLEYSKLYDEAGYSRDWKFDLLAEFRAKEEEFIREQKEREAKEAAEKKAKAAKPKAPKAPKAEEAKPTEPASPAEAQPKKPENPDEAKREAEVTP